MNVLIVGFGSYQADDQVGWMVLDQLQELDTIPSGVSFLKINGNAMAWLSQINSDTQLIFVDAVRSEKSAGFIHCMELSADMPLPQSAFSSHGLGLVESLKLAYSLDLLDAPIVFYGVESDEDNPLVSISQSVLEAIPDVLKQIENYLLMDVKNSV